MSHNTTHFSEPSPSPKHFNVALKQFAALWDILRKLQDIKFTPTNSSYPSSQPSLCSAGPPGIPGPPASGVRASVGVPSSCGHGGAGCHRRARRKGAQRLVISFATDGLLPWATAGWGWVMEGAGLRVDLGGKGVKMPLSLHAA